MTPRVGYEKKDHVARVTLNRPRVLNAMDARTHAELAGIWADVEADDEIRVAVLTGAGDRAFSVGQDLTERASLDRDDPAAVSTFGSRGRGSPTASTSPKPVVAAVRGYALSGGFELALACDLVIAADDAVFGLPEARLGLVPGAGGVFRLARQLPHPRRDGLPAHRPPMDAATALHFGLVNEVVPADRLSACVDGWVDDLCAGAPLSVRAIKQAAYASLDMPLEQAFQTRFPREEIRMHSQDAREGPRAFAERRTPSGRADDRHTAAPGPAAEEVRAMVRIVLTGGSRTAEEIVAGVPAVTGGVWHPRPDIVLTVLAEMTAAGDVVRDGDRHRLGS